VTVGCAGDVPTFKIKLNISARHRKRGSKRGQGGKREEATTEKGKQGPILHKGRQGAKNIASWDKGEQGGQDKPVRWQAVKNPTQAEGCRNKGGKKAGAGKKTYSKNVLGSEEGRGTGRPAKNSYAREKKNIAPCRLCKKGRDQRLTKAQKNHMTSVTCTSNGDHRDRVREGGRDEGRLGGGEVREGGERANAFRKGGDKSGTLTNRVYFEANLVRL